VGHEIARHATVIRRETGSCAHGRQRRV